MKKLIYLFAFILCANFSFAQEWNSTSPDILFAENGSNNLNPIFVGIGTNNPQAQLHTTSSVRFAGLPTSFAIPNFIVGASSNGTLTRFSSDLLNNNNSWLLNGNNGVTNNNFIGTINNQDFRIRTSNTQRMVVTAGGRVGINQATPAMQLDTRYQNNTAYAPNITTNGGWNNSDGLFLYNNQNGGANRFSSITLGSISGGNLSISKINSVGTAQGQSALTFQTENTGNTADRIRERMRITAAGTVEINVQQNADNTLAMHTDGQLQFDNIPTGTGRALVLDANNRVRLANSIIFINGSEGGKKNYIEQMEERILKLEKQLMVLAALNNESIQSNLTPQTQKHSLDQNTPNPTSGATRIDYSIEQKFQDAQILLFDITGKLLESFPIQNESGTIEMETFQLENGTYIYSLEVDGRILESKKLIKNSRF